MAFIALISDSRSSRAISETVVPAFAHNVRDAERQLDRGFPYDCRLTVIIEMSGKLHDGTHQIGWNQEWIRKFSRNRVAKQLHYMRLGSVDLLRNQGVIVIEIDVRERLLLGEAYDCHWMKFLFSVNCELLCAGGPAEVARSCRPSPR
nr:hypothetical protein [Mesorhizobium sp.]